MLLPGLLCLLVSAPPTARAAEAVVVERYSLPNGLDVVLHDDDRYPLVAVRDHVSIADFGHDALDTRDDSVDCVTGSTTIKGGSLGARTPIHLTPPGAPEADNWDRPLS